LIEKEDRTLNPSAPKSRSGGAGSTEDFKTKQKQLLQELPQLKKFRLVLPGV